MIQAIKDGILMEGGIPVEFPVISLGEINTYPNTMLYRNLAAMDTEEMIRAQPIDGVVLIGGCDKMTPALLMGASSANIPTILVTGGPMNSGDYNGNKLGACSDCRHYWQEYRANNISSEELQEINAELAPTAGHCMVMGSASTISVCAETMGIMLPYGSTIPATKHERLNHCIESGKTIVNLVNKNVKITDILTKKAMINAMKILVAIGGSTNTIIHLLAISRRLNLSITLADFDKVSQEMPVIANIRPAGKYHMEDLHKAGGVPVLLAELKDKLYLNTTTVSGNTIGDLICKVNRSDIYKDVIRKEEQPIAKNGGLAVLSGSLAPRGAIIKHASAHIHEHIGPVLIFESVEDMMTRIDDPNLNVDENTILVLRNTGPVGAPGMPEAGYIPIPKKLLEKGIKDMVRITDARMSGTAFGTIILHVAPESAVGGPLHLLKNGDLVEFSITKRSLNILVSERELETRKATMPLNTKTPRRGYQKMYVENVLQADEGCDFKFL